MDVQYQVNTDCTVADPGERPGGTQAPTPLLFVDQTEAGRPKILGGDPPLLHLRVWMTQGPPYLKVWIGHCCICLALRASKGDILYPLT